MSSSDGDNAFPGTLPISFILFDFSILYVVIVPRILGETSATLVEVISLAILDVSKSTF